MKPIVEKLRRLAKSLAEEKGDLKLFAIFLREGSFRLWDVVVAGDWVEQDQAAAITEVAKRVRACLGRKDILKISRIATTNADNPDLDEIWEASQNQQGVFEVRNRELFGQPIEHGYIIASGPRAAA